MSRPLKFAVIADPHGNALALAAVLADIAQRNVDYTVSLGDNANGPLEPAKTVELLRGEPGAPRYHVRGNGDRMTGEGGSSASRSASYAHECLDAGARRWLRELPFTVSHDGWFACHGTPASDTDYLVEQVTERGAAARAPAEVAELVRGVDASLILCGHTHIPRMVRLDDGRLVVNPGSVGLPAYDDTVPFAHRIENDSPEARYAIVTGAPWHWWVKLVRVPYDWASAGEMARAAGWPEWAYNLETGKCG